MQQSNEIKQIKVTDIKPNQFQPRTNFDEKSLIELSNSIKKYGIIEPLIVRKVSTGYELIAGERRLKAALMIGLTEVPAIIMEIDDKESAELAIVENLQRQSLTPIEEAKAYQKLVQTSSIEDIAKQMSKEENIINNKMKLLKLSKEVQESLQNGEISEGHAKALLQLEEENNQNEMLNRIKKERLTVKQVLDIIKEKKQEVIEEIDINPNMQKVLSGLDIVDKKSNTFNDVEPEIVEDKMDKTQMINIDAIKAAAKDINEPEQTADINNLLKVDSSIQKQEVKEERPRFSFAGKFFPSLEDESTNMNTGNNFMEPAKNVEIELPKIPPTEEPITPINIEKIDIPTTTNAQSILSDEESKIDISNQQQISNITSMPQNNINQSDIINTWDIPTISNITPNIEPMIPNNQLSQENNINQNNKIEETNFDSNKTTNFIPNEITNNLENQLSQEELEKNSNFNNQNPQSINIQDEQNFNNEQKELPNQNTTNDSPFLPEFNIEEQKNSNNNVIDNAPTNFSQTTNQSPHYYLRNALNMSRQLIKNLEASGYVVDVDELDLPNEYQFIIKIQKNN